MKLPTLVLLLAIVAGGSFAAGSALPTTSAAPTRVDEPTAEPEPMDQAESQLPPGHPSVGDDMAQDPAAAAGSAGDVNATDSASLVWKAPPRWQPAPNTNSMRLATYRVAHSPGDDTDAELSVTRAGGSPDANAERWIGQFADDGTRTSKRTTRKVGALEASIVEVQGTYSGGMGKSGPQARWALLGAIVPVGTTSYFFKLTGPVKSVMAARSEFDSLVGSLLPQEGKGT